MIIISVFGSTRPHAAASISTYGNMYIIYFYFYSIRFTTVYQCFATCSAFLTLKTVEWWSSSMWVHLIDPSSLILRSRLLSLSLSSSFSHRDTRMYVLSHPLSYPFVLFHSFRSCFSLCGVEYTWNIPEFRGARVRALRYRTRKSNSAEFADSRFFFLPSSLWSFFFYFFFSLLAAIPVCIGRALLRGLLLFGAHCRGTGQGYVLSFFFYWKYSDSEVESSVILLVF